MHWKKQNIRHQMEDRNLFRVSIGKLVTWIWVNAWLEDGRVIVKELTFELRSGSLSSDIGPERLRRREMIRGRISIGTNLFMIPGRV